MLKVLILLAPLAVSLIGIRSDHSGTRGRAWMFFIALAFALAFVLAAFLSGVPVVIR